MHWGCVGFARKGRTGDLGCSFLGPTNHSPSSTKKRHHRQKLFNIPAPGPAAPPPTPSHMLPCSSATARTRVDTHTEGERPPSLGDDSRRATAPHHPPTPLRLIPPLPIHQKFQSLAQAVAAEC